jgi:hypothetical protein
MTSNLPDVIIYALPRPDQHALIFSDGLYKPPSTGHPYGFGIIAFIIFFPASYFGPETTLVASTHVTDAIFKALNELRGQQTFIHAIEALGLAAPYYTPELRPRLRGMNVLHCADNQAANGAFTRGYSACPDLARIVCAAHSAIAELGIRHCLHYTRSAFNIADLPTRDGDTFLSTHTGASRIPFIMPPFTEWA